MKDKLMIDSTSVISVKDLLNSLVWYGNRGPLFVLEGDEYLLMTEDELNKYIKDTYGKGSGIYCKYILDNVNPAVILYEFITFDSNMKCKPYSFSEYVSDKFNKISSIN